MKGREKEKEKGRENYALHTVLGLQLSRSIAIHTCTCRYAYYMNIFVCIPLSGDFMKEEGPQIYEDITKFEELKKLMEERLEDYNMEPGFITMNLVLFRDAIEHGES